MKRPTIIWLILLATAVCVYCLPDLQPAQTAWIKVENDGGNIAGMNTTAATQFSYDPYFIHQNYVPMDSGLNLGGSLKPNKSFGRE